MEETYIKKRNLIKFSEGVVYAGLVISSVKETFIK